jgi:hypothetical protein
MRLRKIGIEKASVFLKNFNKVYDFWKDKAIEQHQYHGDLKLIKESGKVIIYIQLPELENDEYINPIEFKKF